MKLPVTIRTPDNMLMPVIPCLRAGMQDFGMQTCDQTLTNKNQHMKKRFVILFASLLISATCIQAQSKKAADTVVIMVGEASKIIFTIQNRNDLETLKKYDMQALMNDLIRKLEEKDTTLSNRSSQDYLKNDSLAVAKTETEEPNDREDWSDDSEQEEWHHHDKHHKGTYHSFNVDLGMNNYVTGSGFPDQNNSLYTVKPWGSWYVGLNAVQRTRMAQKFFLEWSLGVSWYNFKFQNEKTQISKDDNSVIFEENPMEVNFIKSKLTVAYVQAALVPMVDFGGNKRKPSIFNGRSSDSFRFGLGPYIGYRIDSYSKQVFKEGGTRIKPKDHDNFYLNNIRYGLRVQAGFEDVDLFFNYDMNELFSENKGPRLNAFSFGITF